MCKYLYRLVLGILRILRLVFYLSGYIIFLSLKEIENGLIEKIIKERY